MRQLLPYVHSPSHFLGCELNSVHKLPETVSLRWGLAFPDVYELGMSYLGQKVLYSILNEHPRIWAERVFAPHLQMAGLLREHGLPLCTLESDTPLNRLDILGFSLTHELCYTTVLYMLDLAGIPFRAEDRGEGYPLIVGGGGAIVNPAPLLPFFDCFVVGEGEDIVLEMSQTLLRAEDDHLGRSDRLNALRSIPGVLIPSRQGRSVPGPSSELPEVERRVMTDMDRAKLPPDPVIPFGKPVHDRYTLEIARGCSRGCRFCQSGMISRPVRERSLETLSSSLQKGLEQTGYEDISFLALSAGDFSALDSLFRQSFELCSHNQVGISLPSLRVGSLSPAIMGMLSSLRRTGATLAPEAGSERLRRVINKGITEEELLRHVEQLFSLGWNGVKLYFMIGLPTETEDDLQAIVELCRKVRQLGRKKGRRLRVTASVTPFIPKPHTPFQWEAQLPLDEVNARLNFLRELFRKEKSLELRWHDPQMSQVEGVFSRGGTELAAALESAYHAGDVFTSWQECFSPEIWSRVFQENAIDEALLLGPRGETDELPWDFVNSGMSKRFLKQERARAFAEKPTPDCRYHSCRQCGVCSDREASSLLERQAAEGSITHRLNRGSRDQEETASGPLPGRSQDLGTKGAYIRLWYAKEGPAKYLSQLELQTVTHRMLRKAGLPLAFSRGFHPQPLVSFSRALPVGVASQKECLSVCLRHALQETDLLSRLNAWSVPGLRFFEIETAAGRKLPNPARERYLLRLLTSESRRVELRLAWSEAVRRERLPLVRRDKKNRLKEIDLRPRLEKVASSPSEGLYLVFNWQEGYISPLTLLQTITPDIGPQEYELVKQDQPSEESAWP